jgi:hypothetical protein
MSVRKKLNPNASESNMVVLSTTGTGCCGETLETCKYVAVAANEPLTAVVVKKDGVDTTYTFETPIDPNIPKNVRVGIIAAIKSMGYFIDNDDFMSVTYDAGTLCIIGELEFVSLIFGETVVEFTKHCELGSVCTFIYNVDLDTDPGIVSASLSSAGFQINDTSGFADTLPPADVEEAFSDAFGEEGINLSKVVATLNVGQGFWKVVLTVQNTRDVYISGVKLQPRSCKQGFILPAIPISQDLVEF